MVTTSHKKTLSNIALQHRNLDEHDIVSMVELPKGLILQRISDSNVTEFEEQVVPCCSTSSVNNTKIYETI